MLHGSRVGLWAACTALASWSYGAAARADGAQIVYDASAAPIVFAAAELEAALRARGYQIESRPLPLPSQAPAETRAAAKVRITLLSRAQAARGESAAMVAEPEVRDLRAEGFALRSALGGEPGALGGAASASPVGAAEPAGAKGPAGATRPAAPPRAFWVIGADVAGQMYGGLELAEQIRTSGVAGVTPLARSPHMALRGTKFNLPLDARTPSYSDMSDSAQAAIGDVWDFDFWREYLDQLARHRYNFVSLWNEHPFPSLVRVPEFPDVALADVLRSTGPFDEDYPTIGTGLVTPALLANAQVVRKLTIDEKIEFWRRVMRHAKDRNIDFSLITWNIFTYGVEGKYGITDAIDNPKTVDYFRASVRALFRTYPLLRGIGLTTGENMGDASFEAKEAWAFEAYGRGVLDAARAEPGRQFRFIHRQHQTRAQDIASTFRPLVEAPNVEFLFSFKYAQAHALSSTKQTFHEGYLDSLGQFRTLWTLRNDDALMFRWAAPDFVREFVRNIPAQKSAGYYFGSDMWVWAREFLDVHPSTLQPTTRRALEIDKHWLHFLLWGRLGYDPALSNERIVALVRQRFGQVDAQGLLDAWQNASLIYPLVTGFHWGEFDFQWYIEGCRSRPGPAQTQSGFHDVNRFITLGVHPATDNIPIPRYVEGVTRGERLSGTTPIQVADQIGARASAALGALGALTTAAARSQDELRATLGDIRAMALLGQYYAAKIRGATELALFRATAKTAHRERSVAALTEAARHFRAYTSEARSRYTNPVWTNRVGHVDWAELGAEVERDIGIAAASTPGAPAAAK